MIKRNHNLLLLMVVAYIVFGSTSSFAGTKTYTYDDVNRVMRMETGTGPIIYASAGVNGSITPSGNIVVPLGGSQTFTITPTTGYHVQNVLVDGVSQGAVQTYSFTSVTAIHTISATFAINTYNLTVSKSGTGAGTVTSSPTGINCGTDCTEIYNYGTGIILNAAQDLDYSFAGWSGCDITNGSQCTITMNANKTVEAMFNVLPPVANFSASPVTGSAPLQLVFTDLSSRAPSSWLWNFGDNSNSTLKNPSHIYAIPGTYTVTLTATNSSGSGIITKTGYITAQTCPNLPVRINRATPVYYSTLLAAYDDAASGETIQSQAVVLQENPVFGANKSVTITGGYECTYTTVIDQTYVKGLVRTSGGSVKLGNIRMIQ